MVKPLLAVIDNSPGQTGALKAIVQNARQLSDEFNFMFILQEGSQSKNYVMSRGFPVEELKMVELRKDILALILYLPVLMVNAIRLRRLVQKHNVSLIIANDYYNLLPAACRWMGVRVNYVTYVRFRPSRFSGVLTKAWMKIHNKLASRIVAVSKVVESEIPVRYRNKVKLIYDGIEAADAGSTVKGKIILFPANFTKGKGQEHALKSLAMIKDKLGDWKLRFVGGDLGLRKNREFRASLMEEAKSLAISDRVEWADSVDDLTSEYQASAIVLMFSDSESFSMV